MSNFSLGDLWDEARGIFKDVLDYRLADQELSLARDARAFEAARAQAEAPVTSYGLSSVNTTWLLLGLVAVGGVYFVTRK